MTLHMLNSQEVQDKIARGGARADKLAKDPRPDDEKVAELFVAAIGKKPTAEQLAMAKQHLDKHAKDKKQAYENIVWRSSTRRRSCSTSDLPLFLQDVYNSRIRFSRSNPGGPMNLSVFDLFKIGIGPSTRTPSGRWSRRPVCRCAEGNSTTASGRAGRHRPVRLARAHRRGHATDKAVILGLAGEKPDSVDPDHADAIVENRARHRATSGSPANGRFRFAKKPTSSSTCPNHCRSTPTRHLHGVRCRRCGSSQRDVLLRRGRIRRDGGGKRNRGKWQDRIVPVHIGSGAPGDRPEHEAEHRRDRAGQRGDVATGGRDGRRPRPDLERDAPLHGARHDDRRHSSRRPRREASRTEPLS